jgi:hypothetical protein
VRRHAVFGEVMHLVRADLHFQRPAIFAITTVCRDW